ncbi:MAG TPA: DMT family transporter [Terracidiphilus sp.]|nr:DMT family transporter [Terracidiphilus sp.]
MASQAGEPYSCRQPTDRTRRCRPHYPSWPGAFARSCRDPGPCVWGPLCNRTCCHNRLAETDPPSRTLLWNFGVSAVLLIPIAIAVWKPLSPRDWMILLCVGALYALTQWFIVLAYRYGDAAELSPFNYSVVVFTCQAGRLSLTWTKPRGQLS